MAKYTHFKKKEGKKEERRVGEDRKKKKKARRKDRKHISSRKTRSYVFSFNFMVLRRDLSSQSIQMFEVTGS